MRSHFCLMAIIFILSLYDKNAIISNSVWSYKTMETGGTVQEITVDLSKSLNSCDKRYLSVSLGSHRIIGVDWSEKLTKLASELSPSEIRLGGTWANFFIFSAQETSNTVGQKSNSNQSVYHNVTLLGRDWVSFNEFLTKVGWELMFDINNFLRRSDGFWDSKNTELLLDYSADRQIEIPYFQLGNEPETYFKNFGITIEPLTLIEDYKILKSLISNYPLYSTSHLCGPDVSKVGRDGSGRKYLQEFVTNGGFNVLDEYSVHHYYCDGPTAKFEDFLSVATLNSLKEMLVQTQEIIHKSPTQLPIRVIETSTCNEGGVAGLSDKFIAGFLWLDKLGLCAQHGITRVFRQSFFGASYGLITNKQEPTPDYYLSVLFKKLIEGPVFNVSINPPNEKLRVYAHCASQEMYTAGAIIIYYLNLQDSNTVLSLPQFYDLVFNLFLLTPGDTQGLNSSFVKLNGNILRMSNLALPDLTPKVHIGDVTVPAQSFGFIVIPLANAYLCVNYYDTSVFVDIMEVDRTALYIVITIFVLNTAFIVGVVLLIRNSEKVRSVVPRRLSEFVVTPSVA